MQDEGDLESGGLEPASYLHSIADVVHHFAPCCCQTAELNPNQPQHPPNATLTQLPSILRGGFTAPRLNPTRIIDLQHVHDTTEQVPPDFSGSSRGGRSFATRIKPAQTV